MIAFLAHFDGKRDSIQKPDRLFVFSLLCIRVSLSSNGYVVHAWHGNDTGLAGGHIEFPVFFFVVKSHWFIPPSYLFVACFDMHPYLPHRPVVMACRCRNTVSTECGSGSARPIERPLDKEFIVGELPYQSHYLLVTLF